MRDTEGRFTIKHSIGLYRSPTYLSWASMKQRCKNKNDIYYGGKGISYPVEWEDFSVFYADMGERPEGMTLDRKNGEKSYSTENCKWSTLSEQNTNKRRTWGSGIKHVSIGKTKAGSPSFSVGVTPFRQVRVSSLEKALKIREKLLSERKFINFKGDTMLFDTITYTKRHNEGNYNHSELTVTATIEEGEDVLKVIQSLKTLVLEALTGEVKTETTTHVEKMELKPLGNEPVATANIVKEKAAPRTRAAKPKDVTEEGQAIPPVIPQEAAPSENAGGTSQVVGRVDTANVTSIQSEKPKASSPVNKAVVAYDSTVKEHRSRFATYLGTNFPKWKTCQPEEAIRTFSRNLHGKPFEDTKGNMLPEFKADIETFFVNGK